MAFSADNLTVIVLSIDAHFKLDRFIADKARNLHDGLLFKSARLGFGKAIPIHSPTFRISAWHTKGHCQDRLTGHSKG
jgi:hypothetical protein